MTITTSRELVGSINRLQLLELSALAEMNRLLPRFSDPKELARELIQRTWLTPFQVNQVFLGKGAELVLGPYLLLERLGEGGMGQVFKARQRRHRWLTALKVIRRELLSSARAIERFRREAQAVAQLHHPNIVRFYEASEADGVHYLAMQLIDGVSLTRLVEDQGPLLWPQVVDIVRQTALGLQHAHEHGLVHRDIKPANLLLERTTGLVKILDLGLVRSSSDDTKLTRIGARVGSPAFMAPEQGLDAHEVDIRADIYSLGCTAYHLLTGEPPFGTDHPDVVLVRHLKVEAEPVTRDRPEVPAELAGIVHRMLAKKPEARFQTPTEVVAVLDRMMYSAPSPAVRTARPELPLPNAAIPPTAAETDPPVVSPGKSGTLSRWFRYVFRSPELLAVLMVGVLVLLGFLGVALFAGFSTP